jgi:hypothetical protein
MELEGLKSAWQNHSPEMHALASPVRISRSLQFLRTSAIRDLQRSAELTRFVFSLLFALVAIGASIMTPPPGTVRVAAWLLAAALLVDGFGGLALLIRRLRTPATATMLEFISREHSQVAMCIRFERYSQGLMILLAVVAMLILLFAPHPAAARENAFDALERMAILVAFLVVVWRHAKSRSKDIRRELERYLKDLEK